VVFRDGDIIPRGEDARAYRKAIEDKLVETGDDIGGKTNAEAAMDWWADCFPQHKGKP
jgi:hypothetical protein